MVTLSGPALCTFVPIGAVWRNGRSCSGFGDRCVWWPESMIMEGGEIRRRKTGGRPRLGALGAQAAIRRCQVRAAMTPAMKRASSSMPWMSPDLRECSHGNPRK